MMRATYPLNRNFSVIVFQRAGSARNAKKSAGVADQWCKVFTTELIISDPVAMKSWRNPVGNVNASHRAIGDSLGI